jgi:ABC-type lipoprotein export system ATPase subunit
VSGDVIVRADGVARTFGRGSSAVVAVHGVTCVVRAGDMIALAGASGSGKSTLMHLLAGLDVPTAGTITWPAIGDRAALRPGPIAVVFQAPSLMPPLDVVENVALPLQLAGVDRVTALQSAELALRRLDLESLASSLPDELSGGQAQRVAVARVLVGRPRLILADEPTGQLDHASGAMVIDALITTADEIGAALVVNTHDALVAQRFPQRWTMHDGRLTITSDPTRALAEAGS